MTATRRFRFGFASRSDELCTLVRQYMHHEGDCDIRYEILDPGEEARTIDQFFASGVECIVAYSGGAQAMGHFLNHSLVPIERTDMDIIKGLVYAKQFSRRVAFCSCMDEFRDVENMMTVLDMDLRLVQFAGPEDMLPRIEQAYRDGYELLLGGGLACAHMMRLGGRGILLTPSPHTIRKAFSQAKSIALQKREAEKRRDGLLAILGKLDDGVVCVDSKGVPVFSNHKAHSLLHCSKTAPEDALREHFASFQVPEVLRGSLPSAETILSRNHTEVLVSTMPLHLPMAPGTREPGALVLLRDVSAIQNMDRKIRASLYTRGFVSRYTLGDIAGTSAPLRQMKNTIRSFAAYDSSVHIAGETGSGKELVAHSLHTESVRKHQPFVSVNCSALSEALLESELFGYEEGAFTGAKRGGKLGFFELANKGTLFLDEIGEISPTVQLRLLRVLEAREVMRVGGDRIVPIDVRIVSASNVPLQKLVESGNFRADLYFRLIVLHIQIPPLRERMRDIPPLLEKLLASFGKKPSYLSPELLRAMREYGWPGNVRELLAVMESYLILDREGKADPALFRELLARRSLRGGTPQALGQAWGKAQAARTEARPSIPPAPEKTPMGQARVPLILKALKENNGNRSAAARQLGISYNTVWRLLREAAQVQTVSKAVLS